MWKIVLLFILLTPGILFTVPAFAKKRLGKMNLSSVCVHALIFVLALRWLGVAEGFQKMMSSSIYRNIITTNEGKIALYKGYLDEANARMTDNNRQIKEINTRISNEQVNIYKYNGLIAKAEQDRSDAVKAEAAAIAAEAATPVKNRISLSSVEGKNGIIKLGTKVNCGRGIRGEMTGTVVDIYEITAVYQFGSKTSQIINLDKFNGVSIPPSTCSILEVSTGVAPDITAVSTGVAPDITAVSTGGSGSIISNILSAVGIAVPTQ